MNVLEDWGKEGECAGISSKDDPQRALFSLFLFLEDSADQRDSSVLYNRFISPSSKGFWA